MSITQSVEIPGTTIPAQVLEHCAQHRLLPHLESAVRLAFATFRSAKAAEARIQVDPDTGEERVIIDLTVDAAPHEVLAAKKEYTRQWVQAAPPDVRDRIRLLYHLA